jgi:hypothetical protein
MKRSPKRAPLKSSENVPRHQQQEGRQQGLKAVAMHDRNGNVCIAHEKRENRQQYRQEKALPARALTDP